MRYEPFLGVIHLKQNQNDKIVSKCKSIFALIFSTVGHKNAVAAAAAATGKFVKVGDVKRLRKK